MFRIYLLILFITSTSSIINGCSSVDYSRDQSIGSAPPVIEQSRSQETVRSEELYQPKVITTAALSQDTVFARNSSRPPASRSAVLDLLRRSKAAIDQANYNEAESLLKRALRIEPDNAWLWHNMAVLQFYREDYQQAVQQALKSNNLAKNNQKLKSSNYKVIKQSYIELGEPEKAAQYK